MTREELVEAAWEVTGGSVDSLAPDRLVRLMTVASFVFDLCLNEYERRGLLRMHLGAPEIPYDCDHAVETILTRP